MLLKFTLKNMFTKPLRLFVLLFCVTVTCLAACFASDLGGTITKLFRNMLGEVTGKIDYMISDEGGFDDASFADCPDANVLYVQMGGKREITRDERLYMYAFSDYVSVYALGDMEKAKEMELLTETFTLGENEVAVGKKYSDEYGYQVGDTLTLTDYEDNEFEAKVTAIFTEHGLFKQDKYVVLANSSLVERQNGIHAQSVAFVDVYDDDDILAFKEQVQKNMPRAEVVDVFVSEEMQKLINSVTGVCMLIFVLTFLLVIFVTASFTEKILEERMSVIGTLRSVGISRVKTTLILILENALYGLIGSLAGCGVYALLRPVWTSSLMTTDMDMDIAQLVEAPSWWVYPAVIAGAVLIEVLIPLGTVLAAVKTSIRDIIFATRDTEYTLSKRRTVIGGCMIAAGLLLGFALPFAFCKIFAVVLLTVGAAGAVPAAVRWVTGKLAGFFEKRNLPVAEFAATEAGSKKSSMGNAVLAVTTVIAAAAIFMIGSSLLYWMSIPQYDTDVRVRGLVDEKLEDLEYVKEIEGVRETEFLYESYDKISKGRFDPAKLSGILLSTEIYDVYALPEGDQLPGLRDLPETLADNEICMDKDLADKLEIALGETTYITFRENGVFPVEKEMTLVQYCDSRAMNEGVGESFVLNMDNYRMLYGDCPSTLLIRTDDPDGVKEALEHAMTGEEDIMTRAEYTADDADGSRSVRMALTGVIAAALILTLIGISGNQAVGFAARRKEYALLHSTAMNKRQIRRLILLENCFTFGIATAAAFVISVPMILIIKQALVKLNMGIRMAFQPVPLIGFMFVIWAVVMLTAFAPMRRLRKMNTAEEIKYE